LGFSTGESDGGVSTSGKRVTNLLTFGGSLETSVFEVVELPAMIDDLVLIIDDLFCWMVTFCETLNSGFEGLLGAEKSTDILALDLFDDDLIDLSTIKTDFFFPGLELVVEETSCRRRGNSSLNTRRAFDIFQTDIILLTE